MPRLRPRNVLIIAVALCAASTGAFAYITADEATGTASATASSLPAGNQPTVTVSVTTATVEWQPSSYSGGTLDYIVKRYPGGSTVSCAIGTTAGKKTCEDAGLASGTYQYAVIPTLGNWQGAESTKSENAVVGPVDTTPPIVSSINRVTSAVTALGSVQWTVTFSESVTGADAGDFELAAAGVTGAVLTTVAGSGTTYTVTATTGAGDGSLRLDLVDDDSIVDAAHNELGGAGIGNGSFTGQPYAVDKSPPYVVSITTVGPSSTNATSVQWTVTFSETVTGVDVGDFNVVRTGGPSLGAATITGSGSSYTVSQTVANGTSSVRLDLADNDTIVDGQQKPLGGAGVGNGNYTGETFTFDRTAPTVSSIVRTGQNAITNAPSVQWTVTFSESVTGVDAADFSLTRSGTLSGGAVTSVGGSGSTYTVTASTGTGDGTLRLDVPSTATVTDVATNPLTAAYTGGEAFTLDRTAPLVSSIARVGTGATNGATVQWNVTFSEGVTGVDVADFELDRTGTLAGGAVTAVSGSGSAYTVTASTGTGDGSLRLDVAASATIADVATNSLTGGFTGGQAFTLDRTPPSVLSINRSNPSPTGAATISWTVIFSEAVTGVDASDFVFAATGVTGTPSKTVAGSGTTYTFTTNAGTTTSGTIGLNLVDDDTILDAATNRLGGAGAGNGNFTGEVYTVDRVRPRLSSAASTDGGGTPGRMQQNDTLTFEFSEAIDQSLVPANPTVTIQRSGTGQGSATLSIEGIIQTASISRDYLVANPSSASASGTVTFPDARTVKVTLGAVETTGGPVVTGPTGTAGNVTVKPDTIHRDLAGNAIDDSFTATIARLF